MYKKRSWCPTISGAGRNNETRKVDFSCTVFTLSISIQLESTPRTGDANKVNASELAVEVTAAAAAD